MKNVLLNLNSRALKKVSVIFAAFAVMSALSAVELNFRLTPNLLAPVGSMVDKNDKKIIVNPAFGVTGSFGINLFDLISVGPELGLKYIQKEGNPTYFMDYFGGLNVSAFFYPISRLELQGGLAGGMHFGIYDFPGIKDATGNDYEIKPEQYLMRSMYMRAFMDASFRLSPALSLGAELGYSVSFLDKFSFTDCMISGPEFGLSLKYTINTSKISKKIDSECLQDEPVYPVYANIYKENGFAYARVSNYESAEIRDVKVYFRADQYTSSLFSCGEVPMIRKNKYVDIPLLADFSENLSSITEDGQIPGEIIIEYTLLGKPMTAEDTFILDVYNRNAMKWVDPAIIAMFISPNSNEVLELSKSIVGLARDSLRTGLNRNMQFAMWIVEAINTIGIDYVPGVNTPYSTYHLDMDAVDSIQFPFQTLTYKSGDVDDLAVLTSSLMQAVGIDTALIPLTDDFVVALSMNATEKGVASLVNNPESVIVYNDEVWLPLSMKNIKNGFNASWKSALEAIAAEEEGSEMIILRDAWASYAPVGISGNAQNVKYETAALKKRADKDLSEYLQNEIQPKIRTQAALAQSNPTEANLNALGLLYVRSGDYKNAKDAYNKSAKLGSVSAMSNLANIALLEKNYADAKSWYNKVLEINPEHSGAKKGLERIANEQGN